MQWKALWQRHEREGDFFLIARLALAKVSRAGVFGSQIH
jgi:hypothetical protein